MTAIEQAEHEHVPAAFADPCPIEITSQNQQLTFLCDGGGRLQALLDLIDGAKQSLRLCFYIFAEDKTATRVRDALTRAAQRGVSVTLIVDGFGASADEEFFAPLTEAGGSFRQFSARWNVRYLIRNHQKIVIVDERCAMIGGFNISDSYFEPPDCNGWHDLGCQIRGDAVEQLGQWFDELEDWVDKPEAEFRSIRRKLREWRPGDGPVQVLIGGPTRGLSSWARSVGRDLVKGKRLDMVMAYFSPSARLLRRIGKIASVGEARLVMAGKSDNGATIGATRSLYDYLLYKRAEIYEFAPCKLHMKLIVIDDAVYFGSANFDMRSLYVNLEVMLRIEDAALAEQMREFIAAHVPASMQITREYHKRHASLWKRAKWVASWFLVSVVDYTISRKLNLGL